MKVFIIKGTKRPYARLYAGFTLIELLVVIAIIAILGGDVVAGVGERRSRRLRESNA